MNRRKRTLIYLLISCFGFLFLKNLSTEILMQSSGNCEEIGHIHIHRNLKNLTAIRISVKTSKEENCHSGKSIFASSVWVEAPFTEPQLLKESRHTPVLYVENYFQSPFLEGPKKPPRV